MYKKMSSAERAPRQIAPNALWTNFASASNLIFDSNGTVVSWATGGPAVSTGVASAGALFRDMGKVVYLPAPTVPSSVGEQSTILRKVQLVATGTNGYYGTGGSAGTVGTEFYTGYIRVGGQTYGGGNGAATVFARAN
jgi:hypothetical protein